MPSQKSVKVSYFHIFHTISLNLRKRTDVKIWSFYCRYDIQWAKGHQKITKMDSKRDKRATSINTYVTKRGSLNIRYAEPMDSGLYTCMGT